MMDDARRSPDRANLHFTDPTNPRVEGAGNAHFVDPTSRRSPGPPTSRLAEGRSSHVADPASSRSADPANSPPAGQANARPGNAANSPVGNPASSQAASLHGGASERTLLERIRAGDEDAFGDLFSAYYSALCDFAQSYVRAQDVAEELVQDIFLRIWERHSTWEPVAGIRAYLFAACRNHALDHIKHERIVARASGAAAREDRAPGSGQPPSRPDDDTQAAELGEALRKAVHELPERRRLVVILRWQHGLSHAEIARVLGISVKGVETQFGRAIANLRTRLARFRS